ncbi:hypothetical protein DC366_14495 [Pelagivirga sediminicola]|uniref:Uncharacterized protein n=1 Tax=Pelagivirga sediminicola TaxID=2170575 RepID=A0A2T7G4J0_9RHOB|nr:hypothetical protein [Pelagivirga sediminicola]PVA09329.1 hypothetical protein DC366_14495 [Pelagivirga sediminicola]
MANYIPPVQGKISQIIDVIVLLVLAIGALYLPLFLGLAGSAQTSEVPENVTWDALGQNATMVEKWNELGYATATDAAELITSRFDYSFSVLNLLVMIVVVIGYYFIVLRFSGKEYSEVISEKFGDK